jgi:hypothetical protein
MNIPKKIIANKVIYQPSNTMIWTDNKRERDNKLTEIGI